jgi:hypothetical protein
MSLLAKLIHLAGLASGDSAMGDNISAGLDDIQAILDD